MEFDIDISDLEETPFTTHTKGRVIPNSIFYDTNFDVKNVPDNIKNEDWFMLVPGPKGGLDWVFAESISSTYFGAECANDECDIVIDFLSVYYQFLSWPDIMGIIPDMIDDIRNISASISKIAIYQAMSKETTSHLRRFVITEIEYLFSVCRSLYDLLQFVIKNTWDKLQIEGNSTKTTLKSAFSDMVLHGGKPRTANDLMRKYNLPENLAEFYEEQSESFLKIRTFRDNIAHEGESIDTVFFKNDGIAVRTNEKPYNLFDVWEDSWKDDNELAPIWPFISKIVSETINSLESYISSLIGEGIQVPPPIAPGYELYVRGGHVQNLKYIDNLIGCDIWGADLEHRVKEEMGFNYP